MTCLKYIKLHGLFMNVHEKPQISDGLSTSRFVVAMYGVVAGLIVVMNRFT